MDRQPNQVLLIAGVLLIFSGLVLGAVIPAFTNSRMALSAHQQGIVAGILLVLFGLVWSYSELTDRLARFTQYLLVVGAYTIWTGTLLAAAFGTSRATPIAGVGYVGLQWQEISVSVVLLLGSLATILGAALLFLGLVRQAHRTDKEV